MGILSNIFGRDPEAEKQEAFAQIEQQFVDGQINSAKASWLTDRGNRYGIHHRFDLAIKDFVAALQFEPNRPSTLVSLGGAYNHKGNYKEGIVILENAKNFLGSIKADYLRQITEYNLYYELGNAYFFINDKERAIHYLNLSLGAMERIKISNAAGRINKEEWEKLQKMFAPMLENTKWLLARIR